MQALNLPLLFTVYGLGYKGHPKCDVCDFNNYCLKGCYGSQYETHKELFYPCETVCNLYQAKILFLYEKCKKIAIELKNREINQKLLSIQEILQDKKELYNQWNETIRTLI